MDSFSLRWKDTINNENKMYEKDLLFSAKQLFVMAAGGLDGKFYKHDVLTLW